jgi:hypothetical protein
VARVLRDLGVHVYDNAGWFPWGGYDSQLRADASAMWRAAAASIDSSEIDRIVVLDDGGQATATAPDDLRRRIPMIAVEQTMSGLQDLDRDEQSMPVIAVASSAAKRLIEPPMICAAAFGRAIRDAAGFAGLSMGVIGSGSIGRAILNGMVQSGYTTNVYDPDDTALDRTVNARICASAEELLSVSDVLWGCSGTDFFSDVNLSATAGSAKILISCSSSDREFRTLLRRLNARPEFERVDRLSDISFECDAMTFDVRRGGFPINFDGSPESVPATHIQVTRGLLFAGVVQACSQTTESATLMLSPQAQQAVVNAWFDELPDPREQCAPALLDSFRDEDWIAQNSGGCRLAGVG